MSRVVDDEPSVQEGGCDGYGRAEEMLLPGVRCHQSCEGVLAFRLWTATPHAVEITRGLNLGERQRSKSGTTKAQVCRCICIRYLSSSIHRGMNACRRWQLNCT